MMKMGLDRCEFLKVKIKTKVNFNVEGLKKRKGMLGSGLASARKGSQQKLGTRSWTWEYKSIPRR